MAAKPAMEGKVALFKNFAGLDAIDIEIAENDPKKLIDIINGFVRETKLIFIDSGPHISCDGLYLYNSG